MQERRWHRMRFSASFQPKVLVQAETCLFSTGFSPEVKGWQTLLKESESEVIHCLQDTQVFHVSAMKQLQKKQK